MGKCVVKVFSIEMRVEGIPPLGSAGVSLRGLRRETSAPRYPSGEIDEKLLHAAGLEKLAQGEIKT